MDRDVVREDTKCCTVLRLLSAIIILVLLPSLGNANSRQTRDYDFLKPELSLELPDILLEISGLAILSPATVACIQDENGIVFIYDINRKAIISRYSFHINGDYEDITTVGNTMYVLRSDGTLFEIANYRQSLFNVRSFGTDIPANNSEGLCFDAKNKRLLIGSKSNVARHVGSKDERMIFGFDLAAKRLIAKPVYVLDVNEIVSLAARDGNAIRTNKKGQGRSGPAVKLRISAIAFHPVTDELYILSAADHLIVVLERSGRIVRVQSLDPRLFNKAEGIDFFDNGDMLVSNEGQKGKPTLLRFRYAPR